MGYKRVCVLFDLKVIRTNDGNLKSRFPVHLSGTEGIHFPPNLLLGVGLQPKTLAPADRQLESIDFKFNGSYNVKACQEGNIVCVGSQAKSCNGLKVSMKRAFNKLHTYEDAKFVGKDIYALIVDFTSAFNTTDHDRMR
eukprot:980276-Pelagomonas_calceolata.AAC.2